MKKSRIGLYIRLLGLCVFLTACDILLLFPSGGNMLPAVIVLIFLFAAIGVLSFLLVREIRRPAESMGETGDDTRVRLRRGIGWGVFHLIWLTAGLCIMVWLKIVMRLPDPSVAGVPIPFAVFAGIVVIAIVVTIVRVMMNIGRLKKKALDNSKKE